MQEGQQPVVRGQKKLSAQPCHEDGARRADSGVDYGQKDAAVREMGPAGLKKKAGLRDAVRPDFMAEIDDGSPGRQAQESPLHLPDIRVRKAEIREQNYWGNHAASSYDQAPTLSSQARKLLTVQSAAV